ncbi:hypothetical protein [Pararhodobacter sp.]|uniref:hypothetical protein n=1 Tax=Pararhodobacter sp. TaxID=2127056 RepID=UPI002FDE1BD2
MSAEKHGRPLDEHILSYARQDQKLREAIQTAAGVSLRNVAEIIDEERREFWYARMREAEKSRERAESLAEFVREVTAIAESVLPGVYFDAVQHELA